jgi:hypothetical protein
LISLVHILGYRLVTFFPFSVPPGVRVLDTWIANVRFTKSAMPTCREFGIGYGTHFALIT